MRKLFTFLTVLAAATTAAVAQTSYKVASTFTPIDQVETGVYAIRVQSDKTNKGSDKTGALSI